MGKKENIIKILESLDKENIMLKKEQLELDSKQYVELLDMMKNSGLIKDINITRAGKEKIVLDADDTKITLNGIEYLHHNTKERKYEYKIITLNAYSEDKENEDIINKLGSEGWELVQLNPLYQTDPMLYIDYSSVSNPVKLEMSYYKAIFKK